MDASDSGLHAVIIAVFAGLVGLPLAGLSIAAAASGLGGRRFGFGSVGLGLVVALAAAVVVVVIWRAIGGEVTGWDLLWAAGFAVVAVWCLRRLALPPQASTDQR